MEREINYNVQQSVDARASNAIFHLETHDYYEIYLFLEGDSKYVVEENVYSLEPYDMIIIRKHELHRVYHNSPVRYRRCVLWVYPEFFAENHCEQYERIFTDSSSGLGNKISAERVLSSGLYDAMRRLQKYSDGAKGEDTPVMRAVLTEILYLLNEIPDFTTSDELKSPVNKVIAYLNDHYTENINLDDLEQLFFTSKYHLCRMFKQATGLTIHGYITNKRLLHACELRKEGTSLSDAASLAGFISYSAFYRAYLKQYGVSPKEKG